MAFFFFSLVARNRDLASSRVLALSGPILAFVGTLLAALVAFAPPSIHDIVVVLAAVGTGVGPVALILLWTNLFAHLDMELVEAAVPASFVATLIIAIVIPNLGGGISIVVVSLLPLLSGVLYLLSYRSYVSGELAVYTESARKETQPRIGAIVQMFLLLLVSYTVGCLLPFINPANTSTLLPAPWTESLGMLFAIALAVAIVLFSRRIDLDSLYRWIIAPFALAIILAAFPYGICHTLSAVLGSATFTGLEIIMIIYFIRLATRMHRSPTLLLGLGECAAYTGVLIGYGGGPTTQSLIAGGMLDPKTASLILVGVFICSTLLVPRRTTVWSDPAFTQLSQVSEANMPEKSPMPTAGATANTASLTSSDSFDTRCTRIAERGGLSTRETEIFRMLAQGRSQPYIRDVLYLSKNTVSTHTRHIYKKLDVHSKQELLDLLEDESTSQ